MKQRIQKLLAAAGVASRRTIEAMVREGRVSVNGDVVIDLPILIDPAKDKVEVDGQDIRLKGPQIRRRVYLLMNKPRGIVTTGTVRGEQRSVLDLLDDDLLKTRIYPVGRLDVDAKGLLLLTNDGDLTNRLTHAKFGVSHVYRVIIDGQLHPTTIAKLEKGVWLADEKTGDGFKASLTGIKQIKHMGDRSILEITIKEKQNRHIRRVLAKVGHKVRELTRVRLGPLQLENLALGKTRELTPVELKTLLRAVRNPVDHPADSGKPKRTRTGPRADSRADTRSGAKPTTPKPQTKSITDDDDDDVFEDAIS